MNKIHDSIVNDQSIELIEKSTIQETKEVDVSDFGMSANVKNFLDQQIEMYY
jgi:hypothetical protein